MKISGFIGLVLMLLVKIYDINAQNYMDILNVKYNYLPDNHFKETDTVKTHLTSYTIDLSLPLELKNHDVILLGAVYDRFKAVAAEDMPGSLNLTSIKFSTGYLHNWKNKRWISYFELMPKLNSDMKNIKVNHFQFGGTVLNYFKKTEKMNYQFGLFYNGEAYGPFIVPLVGIEWFSGGKTYISVLLPAFAIFEYKVSQKLFFGGEVELCGESYRLGNSIYEHSFISNFGENKLTFLIKTKFFIDFYVSKSLVIYFKPGWRLMQKFEQFTEADQLIALPDRIAGNLKNSFYFEIGAAFRFRFNEAEKKE